MTLKKIPCLLFVIVLFALGSCYSAPIANPEHNARNSTDWVGIYSGTIPSASGSGINVRLTLNPNETFELQYSYIDRPSPVFTNRGTFTWNDAGNIITLNTPDFPPFYFVSEGYIIQLDMQGNIITGTLANRYVIGKE